MRAAVTLALLLGVGAAAQPSLGQAPTQQSAACTHPATVDGHFDPKAPNLTVLVRNGFEPRATAELLAQKYHLTLAWVYTYALRGFAIKDIDVSLIPKLQCEPSIELLSFDLPTSIS